MQKDRRQKKINEKKRIIVENRADDEEENQMKGPFKQFAISADNIFMRKPLMENKNDGNLMLKA